MLVKLLVIDENGAVSKNQLKIRKISQSNLTKFQFNVYNFFIFVVFLNDTVSIDEQHDHATQKQSNPKTSKNQ